MYQQDISSSLLPALNVTRGKAKGISCKNSMKQLGMMNVPVLEDMFDSAWQLSGQNGKYSIELKPVQVLTLKTKK